MRRNFVIFCALLLAVPVAAANWHYRGSNEPDTVYDTSTFMFSDPDTNPSQSLHKIYFNGFARIARETHYNPNVGALGTRMQPVVTAMSSVLGFWKDCNRDGYIGHIEQGFLEYRNELLLDKSICPVTSPGTPVINSASYVYPHNDGTWVRELIWIGDPIRGAPSQNPTNFYAAGTAVWADWGLPGGKPTLVCPGGNVGVRSTGVLLEAVDCNTYFRGVAALNTLGGPFGGWDEADVDNSDAPLNIDNPAYPFLYGPAEPDGHPEEGDFRGFSGGFLGRDLDGAEQRPRVVTIWDCDANTVSTNPDPKTPGNALDPATYPSVWESVNDTYEGGRHGDCHRAAGELPYPNVEGHSEPTRASAGRDAVDFSHEFSPGSRNTPGGSISGTCVAGRPVTTGSLGNCPPADLGLAVERDDLAIGPAWRTNAQVNTYATTVREQLSGPSPDFGGFYYTFYARLGALAMQVGTRPSPFEGVYGSEACAFTGPSAGIQKFWNCNPAAWVHKCNESDSNTPADLCQQVGWKYHMRDIDCWDGTLVRGAGIRASLADTSPSGPCQTHPGNDAVDVDLTR